MSLIFAGGLWSVFVITALGCGYIWALNGPRWGYKALILLAIFVITGSQFLPTDHPFRQSVAAGLHWWKWALALAAPVLAYGLGIRWINKKIEARHDP